MDRMSCVLLLAAVLFTVASAFPALVGFYAKIENEIEKDPFSESFRIFVYIFALLALIMWTKLYKHDPAMLGWYLIVYNATLLVHTLVVLIEQCLQHGTMLDEQTDARMARIPLTALAGPFSLVCLLPDKWLLLKNTK